MNTISFVAWRAGSAARGRRWPLPHCFPNTKILQEPLPAQKMSSPRPRPPRGALPVEEGGGLHLEQNERASPRASTLRAFRPFRPFRIRTPFTVCERRGQDQQDPGRTLAVQTPRRAAAWPGVAPRLHPAVDTNAVSEWTPLAGLWRAFAQVRCVRDAERTTHFCGTPSPLLRTGTYTSCCVTLCRGDREKQT